VQTAPILVLSGGFDPISPPDYGARTANLLGARHVHIEGGSHAASLSSPCGAGIAQAFFTTQSLDLDVSCAAAGAPVFVTDAIVAPGAALAVDKIVVQRHPLWAGAALALAAAMGAIVFWPILGWSDLKKPPRGPGLPVALASLCLLGFAGGLVFAVARVAAGPQAPLLAVGLPGEWAPLFALPGLAVAALLYAAWRFFRDPHSLRAHVLFGALVCLGALTALTALGLAFPAGT
jgi:hypothetical protein